MNRRDLLELWNVLEFLADLPGEPRFARALVLNRARLRPIIEHIEAKREPPMSYIEYENQRRELCEQYARCNEDGTPRTCNGSYDIDPERRAEFDEKVKELTDSQADSVKAYQKHRRNYNEFLDEQIADLELVRIDIDLVPVGITTRQLEVLNPLIVAL